MSQKGGDLKHQCQQMESLERQVAARRAGREDFWILSMERTPACTPLAPSHHSTNANSQRLAATGRQHRNSANQMHLSSRPSLPIAEQQSQALNLSCCPVMSASKYRHPCATINTSAGQGRSHSASTAPKLPRVCKQCQSTCTTERMCSLGQSRLAASAAHKDAAPLGSSPSTSRSARSSLRTRSNAASGRSLQSTRALESEVRAIKAITARADLLGRLDLVCAKLQQIADLQGGFVAVHNPLMALFHTMVAKIRLKTMDAIECVSAWQRSVSSVRPFVYGCVSRLPSV
jgi:hypothetical protein